MTEHHTNRAIACVKLRQFIGNNFFIAPAHL